MNFLDTGLGIAVVFFLVFLARLWLCLPFAIFGKKQSIEESIKEQKSLRKEIEDLHATIKQNKSHV